MFNWLESNKILNIFTSGNRVGHSAIWRARLTDAGKFGASPIVMLLK